MLHSKFGSIYRVILACLIACAFVFALSWPQYTKHRNATHARQAAELARALAFAQESYRASHGAYTPDFRQLEVTLSCPMAQGKTGLVLDCHDYTYRLENGIIWVEHKTLPVWLEVDIANGAVQCKYKAEDWAGQELCGRLSAI